MLTTQKRKIISLNLAVILVLLAAFPTVAAETAEPDPQSREEALLAKRMEYMERIEANGEEAQAELSAEEPYRLQVGTKVFDSDRDQSGAGWAYTAANHRLVLDGYQGGGIAASGDLVIYTYGENQVTGRNGTYYGQDGIVTDGVLEVNVEKDSTLQVVGGSGRNEPGQGISANRSLIGWIWGALYAQGGDVASAEELGGWALCSAERMSLYGIGDQAIVAALGGAAENYIGGCGISAPTVYIDVNCVAVGGSGRLGGDGIYFIDNCTFGVIEGYFAGGESSVSSAYDGVPARSYESGASWYYDEHTTLTEAGRELAVTINEYTLRINGSGGLCNGQSQFSDTQKYPAAYPLSDYIFQRDKYTQVGWRESTSFVALNGHYIPRKNTTLSAEWLMVDPGDIVINSLFGTLDDGSHYRSQRTTLTLPTKIQGYEYAVDLLGWSSTVDAENDPDTHIMRGVWYEGGDVVQPDKNSVKLLYARIIAGKYVRYHPNGGTVQGGGTIMVQGTTATTGALEVYAMGDSAMIPPQGCVFRGWSRAANVDAIRYKAGESIVLPDYPASETIDLYAVWEQVEFVETLEPGVQVRSNTDTGKVTVELTQDWCRENGSQTVIAAGFAADGTAKLLRSAMTPCGEGDVELTLNCSSQAPVQVKLFALDDHLAPVCTKLETVVFLPQDQN